MSLVWSSVTPECRCVSSGNRGAPPARLVRYVLAFVTASRRGAMLSAIIDTSRAGML